MTDTQQENLQAPGAGQPDPRQRLLKWLVIFLAVLLVAGFAVVIATIVYRMGTADEKRAAGPVATETPVSVNLPADAKIVDILIYKGELALHLAYSDGRQAVMILDPETRQLTPVAEFR